MRRGRFYGQHGEDVVAWHALGNSEAPRFFVEVGLIDGRRFSNTLAFEERGWRGVCVEAHPEYIDLVRANRSGSVVVHAAASNHGADAAPFFAEPRGALSSLMPRSAETLRRRYGDYFEGFRVVDVPVRTLDDILADAGAPAEMELISIDVEGAELPVLEGLDLARWRPRAVVAEANDAASAAQLRARFEVFGYALARVMGGANHFFAREARDCDALRNAPVDRPYVHTRHPIDGPGRDQLIRPRAARGRLARWFS